MAEDQVLRLEHVSKDFFGVYAITDVCLELNKGEVLGLIGENGAGKSTMMNIVCGVLQPTSGSMFFEGKPYEPKRPGDAENIGISFIHQELNLFNNLNVIDNMFINGFKRRKGLPLNDNRKMAEIAKKALAEVGLDISPYTKVEKLSMGERQLIEIAKSILGDPKVIIFDEPTTSLTNKETEKLFAIIEKLKKEGRSIIYISHILEDVQRLTDKIAVLRDGVITAKGKTNEFTIDTMISNMVGRSISQMYPPRIEEACDEVLLSVKNLNQPGVVKNINLELHKGEILGLYGLMGAGRSELANIIFGLDEYESGEIVFKGKRFEKQDPIERLKAGVGYVTENRKEEGLFLEFPVAENINIANLRSFSKRGVVDNKAALKNAEDSKKMFGIKCEAVNKHLVKGLSGGNQQKVVIAKWVSANPEFLIVDEPTRGIDVGAKSEVYSILNELARKGTGILMVSSEMEELIGNCNRIIVMNKGMITGELNNQEICTESLLHAAFNDTAGM